MSDADKPLNKKDQKRLDEKRGEGAGKDYVPFIQVADFSSSGESIRVKSATIGRTHHFLSGIELAAFLLFDWNSKTADIREQFPIPLSDTLNICRQLGIRHPQVKGELKIVTTDLLIDFHDEKQLAITAKPAEELDEARTVEKLQIEKAYWEDRNTQFRFFTDQEVSKTLAMNLKWLKPFLSEDIANAYQLSIQDVVDLFARIGQYPNESVTRVCARLDDSYQVEPGYHIEVLRFGVAKHYLQAPLEAAFHHWKCLEIVALSSDGLDFGVGNAS